MVSPAPPDLYSPGVTASNLGEMVFGNLVKGSKAQLTGSAAMPHSFAYIEDVGQAAAVLGTREEALGSAWITPHAPARTQLPADRGEERDGVLGPEVLEHLVPVVRVAALSLRDDARIFEMSEADVVGCQCEPCAIGLRNPHWQLRPYLGEIRSAAHDALARVDAVCAIPHQSAVLLLGQALERLGAEIRRDEHLAEDLVHLLGEREIECAVADDDSAERRFGVGLERQKTQLQLL